jgi:DNA polymerase III epsilon subunit-like protein
LKTILVVDTETTGVDVKKDKAVEVGWLEVDEELNIISEFVSYVNPGMPIPPDASAVNNIYDETVADAPKLSELPWPEGDIVIVGHNISYDVHMVAGNLNVVEEVCSMRLARRYYPGSVKNHKLQNLMEEFELPLLGDTHSALGDCHSVITLLKYIGKFAELRRELRTPHIFEVMPIGKFRGKPCSYVPAPYWYWVLDANFDADMRSTANYCLGR